MGLHLRDGTSDRSHRCLLRQKLVSSLGRDFAGVGEEPGRVSGMFRVRCHKLRPFLGKSRVP